MTPSGLSLLGGLLPAAGAIALVGAALRDRARRPRTERRSAVPMSFPIEPPAGPDPRRGARRVQAPRPPGACRVCGTETPAGETTCARCAREAAPGRQGGVTTLMHWAVFVAMMTAIIGAGCLVAP
ncbi:MAG: hypothetical protein N2Z62_04685 [Rhodobacteraceae bacterium]|nr:hypothetical protein [Paracoccaceae bacterium]